MTSQASSFYLWIDGVGGFLLLTDPRVWIGGLSQTGPHGIRLQADLPSRAAVFKRIAGTYTLRPADSPTWVDTHQLSQTAVLGNSHRVRCGQSTEFQFCKPHPLSGSARLTMYGRVRFSPAVDGALLLDDTLVIGPTAACHVHAPLADQSIVIARRNDQWLAKLLDADIHDSKRFDAGSHQSLGGLNWTLETR